MKTVIVTLCGRYKDGGTEEFRDKKNNRYFIDGRINSKTKGKVFDKYPGDKEAKTLDIVLCNAIN